MKTKISLVISIILLLNLHVSGQKYYKSKKDFFKVKFPYKVEEKKLDNENANIYFCEAKESIESYFISVRTYEYSEIEKNSDSILNSVNREFVENLVFVDEIDTTQIEFKGYKCNKTIAYSSFAKLIYEMYSFRVYNKVYVILLFDSTKNYDKEKFQSFLNSFEVIETRKFKKMKKKESKKHQ